MGKIILRSVCTWGCLRFRLFSFMHHSYSAIVCFISTATGLRKALACTAVLFYFRVGAFPLHVKRSIPIPLPPSGTASCRTRSDGHGISRPMPPALLSRTFLKRCAFNHGNMVRSAQIWWYPRQRPSVCIFLCSIKTVVIVRAKILPGMMV